MKKFFLVVLFGVFLGLQYRLWFGDGNLFQVKQMIQTLDQERKVTQSLKERNAQLAAEVEDLKTRLEALEERSRRDLGMVHKGETFYLFAPTKK